MVRLAIVGCGEHSRTSHAAPLARYAAQQPGEIELVAACDLNADRAAEFCQVFGFARAYTEVEKMLATERIDGCVCVMPMPYLNSARSWINEMGPLRYVRATQVRHARSEPDFIWSTAIHVLDALRHIAGEIADFDAEVQRRPEYSAPWYVISLRFETGANGRIEVLPTAGMVEESYELFGEGFRARVTAGSGTQRTLEFWRNGQKVMEAKTSDDEPEDLRNGGYEEVVEFVRALRSGTRPRPEIQDILPSARICFAIADFVARQTVALDYAT